MPLLYGAQRPLKLPGFVTGRETPGQQAQRLRDINDAIKKQEERDEERKNQELFTQLESLGGSGFPQHSQSSPPRPTDLGIQPDAFPEMPPREPGKPWNYKLLATGSPSRYEWVETDEEPTSTPGSQARHDEHVGSCFDEYEGVFGTRPQPGSQAEGVCKENATKSWLNEQEDVPKDVVIQRMDSLSTETDPAKGWGGLYEPKPDVDSKYDIAIDSLTADIASVYVRGGVPLEGGWKRGVGEDEALRYAKEAMDEGLKGLEEKAREALGKDATDQDIREYMYQALSLEANLSDVLDEWGVTDEARQDLPQPVIDEALRRTTEETGKFLPEPEEPGTFESLAGGLPGPLGTAAGVAAVVADPVLEGAEWFFKEKWIPAFLVPGLTPRDELSFLSLDDVNVMAQAEVGDPTAGLVLRGEITKHPFGEEFPSLEELRGGAEYETFQTGTGLGGAARAGELGFGEVTGVETTAVSDALRSQLAEDILSEAISPEYITIAIPFVNVGVKGLTGLPKLTRITANLITGTDVGLARGFPLLRPASARAVLRGLTAVGKSPLALKNIPVAVKQNPVFQRGVAHIRAVRAGDVNWWGTLTTPRLGDRTERLLSNTRRGFVGYSDDQVRVIARSEGIKTAGVSQDDILQALADKQYLRQIRADDPVVLRQVIRDMGKGIDVDPRYVPLEQAIKADLVGGRSLGEILQEGLRPRGVSAKPLGDVTVYHGVSSLDESHMLQRGIPADSTVFVERGLAEEQARFAAKVSGGEARVFSTTVPQANLAVRAGEDGWTLAKARRVSSVAQNLDDALSPALKAVVRAERAGEKITFNTLRGPMNDELRVLKTAVQEGRATEAEAARASELHGLLQHGEAGFEDTLRAFAEGELGLRIPPGASIDRVVTRITEAVDTPVSKWGIPKLSSEAGGGRLGFLPDRAVMTEQELFRHLGQGRLVSHADLERVATDTVALYSHWITEATDIELLQVLQARRLDRALAGVRLGRMSKSQLIDLIDQVALPISKTAPRNTMLRRIAEVRKGFEAVPETIKARVLDHLTEERVSRLFMLEADPEAVLVPAAGLPTQLIKSKHAARLHEGLAVAFDPGQNRAARRAHIDKYVAEVEKIAARHPEGSIGRIVLEQDAKLARWSWDVRFGIKPLKTAQSELRENLRILTSEHRGTVDERLAKLSTERAKELVDDVDDFLSPFTDLSKTQASKFRERILTQVLDAENGVPIYDAGRQLEVMLDTARVSRGTKNEAFNALKVLTTQGATPSPEEVAAMRLVLNPVLGSGATRQLLNARKLTTKGGELVINTIGLPRALMASSDISALWRQGAMLGARMPIQWTKMAARSIRAFWQPEYAVAVRDSILHSGVIRLTGGETVDLYEFAKKVGLFFGGDAGQLGRQALTYKEEMWMTHFASKWGWHLPRDVAGKLSVNPTKWHKIPFPVPLAQSERAYVQGLDKLRMDFFTNEARKFIRRGLANGRPVAKADFEQLALFVNNASGRGKLAEWMRTSSPILNALFFAPRLVVSRFTIWSDVARHTVRGGPMRRAVWETLAADAATAATALYLIEHGLGAVGVDAHVGLNPLDKGSDGKWRVNTDFLKVRIGETRIDFMASMGPVQRVIVKLGAAALQGDGDMAGEIALRFLRSKASPIAGGFVDVISGKDFVGGKIELSLHDLLADVAASRVIPLSWQGPIEAVAAARGEIDIDIGNAIVDMVTDLPTTKDEAVVAGAALSAELLGAGVVSYFRPGEKLRELDNEKLQEMLTEGEIKPTAGQTIEDMDDLNAIQAKQVRDDRGPEEKGLEEKQVEEGLWRDSDWAKNKKDEEEFHASISQTGGYYHPKTGEFIQLQKWSQSELDAMLLSGQIDGSDWRFRTSQNTAASINTRNALFPREEEDIEDIENPVDKLIAEYYEIQPINFQTPDGEYDYEAFQAKRDAKQAEIATAVGDPEAVAEYFDSFKRETDLQKRGNVAQDQRDVLLDEIPKYMDGVGEAEVANRIDEAHAFLDSVGSSWSVARYLAWLFWQGEEYQTNVNKIAYWVAAGDQDEVVNPERTRMVLQNPDLVMFYPGLFRGLTDEGQQSFLTQHGGKYLSKGLKEYVAELVEGGELSTQSEPETELFRSRPVFGEN